MLILFRPTELFILTFINVLKAILTLLCCGLSTLLLINEYYVGNSVYSSAYHTNYPFAELIGLGDSEYTTVGLVTAEVNVVVLFQPTSRRLRTCARTPMRICLLPLPATFTMFYITSFRLSLKRLNTTIYVNVHTASSSPLELDISQTRTLCSACCTWTRIRH